MAVGRKKNSALKKSPTGVYRLIAGKWRSRRLQFPEVTGLRPTTDRVRETVFNWLQPELPGARVLDLFAGSGALGFEALSRGAAHATMIERDTLACRFLRENAQALEAPADIVCDDAMAWLARADHVPVDIIFLDPPFRTEWLKKAVALLAQQAWCKAGTRIYVERALDQPSVDLPRNWQIDREKQAGQVSYALLTVTGVSE